MVDIDYLQERFDRPSRLFRATEFMSVLYFSGQVGIENPGSRSNLC